MPDWDEIVRAALVELGADKTFVKGAKLRQKVQELGAAHDQDLQTVLQEGDQKFSELVDTVADVQVRKSPGSDMLVGLSGADLPPDSSMNPRQKTPTRFRDDVYRALTTISEQPYFYVKSQGVFTQAPGASDDDRVELPKVTLESMIQDRNDFLEQLTDGEAKEELLTALEDAVNPLSRFQSTLSRHGLARDWHWHNLTTLQERLHEWAARNELPVASSWAPTTTRQSVQVAPRPTQGLLSSQALLSRLAAYMTEDEIRPLLVPFGAVEKMYRDLNRDTPR